MKAEDFYFSDTASDDIIALYRHDHQFKNKIAEGQRASLEAFICRLSTSLTKLPAGKTLHIRVEEL